MLAGGLALSPAWAADLGGDCCADLEERVAELEATTVRKGNRKVSVKLSGQVNTLLLVWNDGEQTDAYVVDNTESSTRFRFAGKAEFKPGWSAGFLIELEVEGARSVSVDQKSDGRPNENADGTIEGRKAAWFIKSDRLGEVWVGRFSPATDDIKLEQIAATPDVDATFETGAGFFLRAPQGVGGCAGAGCIINIRLGALAPDGDTRRGEIIRYNTPSLAGFVLSVSWGEDDLFDLAARYDKQWNSIHIKGGIGYSWDSDENESNDMIACPDAVPVGSGFGAGAGPCRQTRTSFERLAGSLSVMHKSTGLYAYFGGHRDDFKSPSGTPGPVTNRTSLDTGTHWYIQSGIKRRFLAPNLGATTVYGQYQQWNDFQVGASGTALATTAGIAGVPTEITDSKVKGWGVGIIQDIEMAAMQIWTSFQHYDPDADVIQAAGVPSNSARLEDLWFLQFGGKIKF